MTQLFATTNLRQILVYAVENREQFEISTRAFSETISSSRVEIRNNLLSSIRVSLAKQRETRSKYGRCSSRRDSLYKFATRNDVMAQFQYRRHVEWHREFSDPTRERDIHQCDNTSIKCNVPKQ